MILMWKAAKNLLENMRAATSFCTETCNKKTGEPNAVDLEMLFLKGNLCAGP
jgi:hypothetical protein